MSSSEGNIPVSPPILPGSAHDQVFRMLESITDGFSAFDADWRFIYLNRAAQTMMVPHMEGPPSRLLGQIYWEVFPEIAQTAVKERFLHAAATQSAVEFEVFYGPWGRWFSVRAFPIPGGGLSSYFRDITEVKKAADLVRESESKYDNLLSSMGEGFCVIELDMNEAGQALDYRFLEVNPAFEIQSGIRNATGSWMRELYPGHEEFWFKTYGQVALTGRPARFRHKATAVGKWFDVFAFRVSADVRAPQVAVLFNDITSEQEARENALHANQEIRARSAELDTLLEVLPIGIGIALDPACREIRANPVLLSFLELGPDANSSKTAPPGEKPELFRVLDEQGREIPDEMLPMQRAARDGIETRALELTIEHRSGRRLRLLQHSAPLYDDEGRTRGSVGTFVDVTERRKTEEYHRFLNRLDDGIRPLTDPEEIVAAAARLLGEHLGVDRCAYATVEADEDTMHITGNYCREVPSIVGRWTFAEFGPEVLQCMRSGRPYVTGDIGEDALPGQDLGSFRHMMIRAVICVPLQKSGKFAAAMAVHHSSPRPWEAHEVDLVHQVANRCWESLERAQISRALRESDERFRLLADSIAQLAWIVEADGTVVWYNRRWHDFAGTGPGHLRDRMDPSMHHPDHLERVSARWAGHLDSGEEWEDTFPLRRADGEYRWFLSRAFPMRDEQGKVLRWFGTDTDVTEQRLAADALTKAKEEAERANAAKDQFLAVLSHELRTPLTPVLLILAALELEETLSPAVSAQLHTIRRNVELEARLIDDLLDITRITRGRMPLRLEATEAHTALELALNILEEDIRQNRLTVEKRYGTPRVWLQGDPARLQQVFWNLLKNAIKFTPAGGLLEITTELSPEGEFSVSVKDSGVGLAPDSLESIFGPFEQGGLSRDHQFGGLGLGLFITRAIVERHHGKITASSPGRGKGAEFRIMLPASAGPPEDLVNLPPAPDAPGVRLRILLVEDHQTTLEVLTRLLEREGHAVTPAGCAAEALEAAQKGRFDIVVSDIGLPDGNGFDLMDTLRRRHGLMGIALTGYGMEGDLRRAREAGFAAHLTKPVSFAQLKRLLHVLPGRSGEAADEAGGQG